MKRRNPTIIDAANDPNLFAAWFKNAATWHAWFVFLRALFALPAVAGDNNLFQQCTGRNQWPVMPASEAWLIVGRRGGKSFIVALLGVFLACFRTYSRYLTPGERGTVVIIATDRKQARTIFRYVRALLEEVPMLKRLMVGATNDTIELNNRVNIEIHTASFRAVRGYTVVAALLDETAFWRSDESANPDTEILAALRPAMATIPGAMLLGVSSPYARRGVLWEAFRDHHGKDGSPVLVWRAATETMNPSIDPRVIADAYQRDPLAAAAEYGAEFRSDVSTFLNNDWLDRAVLDGMYEAPPRSDCRYFAFADPSGGGSDAFTLAIAHLEGDGLLHLDCLRSRRPPFDPAHVVADFADVLKRYGLHVVHGDRYAGEWVPSAFRKAGISYEHSERTRSEIYLESEPLFAQGLVRLVDNRTLLTELRQLERRTGRGRDIVDHPPRGHDDHANAACGALVLASKQGSVTVSLTDIATIMPREQSQHWQAEHSDSPWPIGDDASPWT